MPQIKRDLPEGRSRITSKTIILYFFPSTSFFHRRLMACLQAASSAADAAAVEHASAATAASAADAAAPSAAGEPVRALLRRLLVLLLLLLLEFLLFLGLLRGQPFLLLLEPLVLSGISGVWRDLLISRQFLGMGEVPTSICGFATRRAPRCSPPRFSGRL